jgi:hypothetical protein
VIVVPQSFIFQKIKKKKEEKKRKIEVAPMSCLLHQVINLQFFFFKNGGDMGE